MTATAEAPTDPVADRGAVHPRLRSASASRSAPTALRSGRPRSRPGCAVLQTVLAVAARLHRRHPVRRRRRDRGRRRSRGGAVERAAARHAATCCTRCGWRRCCGCAVAVGCSPRSARSTSRRRWRSPSRSRPGPAGVLVDVRRRLHLLEPGDPARRGRGARAGRSDPVRPGRGGAGRVPGPARARGCAQVPIERRVAVGGAVIAFVADPVHPARGAGAGRRARRCCWPDRCAAAGAAAAG